MFWFLFHQFACLSVILLSSPSVLSVLIIVHGSVFFRPLPCGQSPQWRSSLGPGQTWKKIKENHFRANVFFT